MIILTGGWPKVQRIDRLFIFGLLHLGIYRFSRFFAISAAKKDMEKRDHQEHGNDPYEQIGDTLDAVVL